MKVYLSIISVIILLILVLSVMYYREEYSVVTYTRIGQDSINYPDFYNAAKRNNKK
jgi:hypothetical protein